MFKPHAAFSGFSIRDEETAKQFYTQTLGLKLIDEKMGLTFELPGGGSIYAYQKGDHQPATFTILNFVVADIDAAIDALVEKGVSFERYDTLPADQDDKGVLRGLDAGQGPDIAWFKDPSDNILSVMQLSEK